MATSFYQNNFQERSEEFTSLVRRTENLRDELSYILEMNDHDSVYWCEIKDRYVSLHSSPLDISPFLQKELLTKEKAITFTSATLSTNNNLSFFKSTMGITESNELLLPSYFDYKKQVMLYLPKENLDPQNKNFIEKITKKIKEILTICKGRAFVLFTSYYNMNCVFEKLNDELSYTLLRQGDKPKRIRLEEFRNDLHSVLFASTSFWQGVDVPGDALSCVIIDKLPFAVPTEPIIEAKAEYFKAKGKNPFIDYHVPKAIINFKQGFGRLIRNNKLKFE